MNKLWVMKIDLLFTASLLAACLLPGRASSQDIHFSQFYENAILRNPALTGIFTGDYKAGVNYRNQWGNISVPFQTVLASVEAKMPIRRDKKDYFSFGVTATYDKAGSIDFTSVQVYPAINYNKSLDDRRNSYLSVGFAGGYVQRSVDMTKMTLDNQYVNGSYSAYNPTGERMSYTKLTHYDLSAGVSLNSSAGNSNQINYFVGAAAYHLTRPREAFNPNESFIRLNTKYTASFGLNWRINTQSGLTIHANHQVQGPYRETIFGGLLSWRNNRAGGTTPFAVYGGCFYRVNDAVIPTFKLDYKTYSFTASYDITHSGLRMANTGRGGWELSVFVRGKLYAAPG